MNRPDSARRQVCHFALSEVRLLESPFQRAMERNARYLLSLDPDRFLHNTRKYAGLKPKGPLYGGWESRGIAGHSLGHYLTAISQQYAATGDERFRERIEYIVSGMAECQKLYGDGYVGALQPRELETLRGLRNGQVEVDGHFYFKGGAWVPWYTQHKILAGLKDAWVLGGSSEAKEVTLTLAAWVDDLTANLSPEQQQTMLQVEFGGMSETLIELYALTSDPRYLEASQRFYHRSVLEPLLEGRDELAGKHANTQIPKILGEARRYEATGEPEGRAIATFFWDRVVNHHSWAIGGNSDREHFFPEGKEAEHLGPQTAETCNTYNMLELTGHLFEWEPSVALGDFQERALFNHILASQEPRHAMFTYFVPLKPGHFKTYSSAHDSFWCCVGSGMENHTKYGRSIYYPGGDNLYVNLFIPSELTWKEKGLVLRQQTQYPAAEQTELEFVKASAEPLTLHVRCPSWAKGPLTFELNGQPLEAESKPGAFAVIRRTWHAGDKLRIRIPMPLRTESLPDAPTKRAILHGPVVLAGDLGAVTESATFPLSADHVANDRAATAEVPVLITSNPEAILGKVRRVPGESLAYRTHDLGRPHDVTLRPLSDLPYHYYNVYWDVLSESEWEQRETTAAAAREKQRREEARIVDELRPGEQQSEVDHGLTSERSFTGDVGDRKWRDARDGGWFEFRQKVLPDEPQVLRCTYWGDDDGARAFDILIDGRSLATQRLSREAPGQFFNVEYPIPAQWIAGKKSVTVRFQAHPQHTAGGLIHCAVLKAPPE